MCIQYYIGLALRSALIVWKRHKWLIKLLAAIFKRLNVQHSNSVLITILFHRWTYTNAKIAVLTIIYEYYIFCVVHKRFSIERCRFHWDFRPWYCSREISSANIQVYLPASVVTQKLLYFVHKRLVKIKSKITNVAQLTSRILSGPRQESRRLPPTWPLLCIAAPTPYFISVKWVEQCWH